MTVIAIDGVAGSGKSTLARGLARALDWNYLDTGAMYRSLALLAIRSGIDFEDEDSLLKALESMECVMPNKAVAPGEKTPVKLNGEDVTAEIRGPEASQGSSAVAVHKKIRELMVQKQQEWVVAHDDCVVEGRDIGSVVCPNADFKFFLTADHGERAARRAEDHDNETTEATAKAMAVRDENDSTRGGLTQVPDALVIDTTDLEPQQTLEKVLKIIRGGE